MRQRRGYVPSCSKPRAVESGEQGSARGGLAVPSDVLPGLSPCERSEQRKDLVALSLLALAAVVVTILAIGDAAAYIRGDWPTYFFPMYAFLGEQLRAFD